MITLRGSLRDHQKIVQCAIIAVFLLVRVHIQGEHETLDSSQRMKEISYVHNPEQVRHTALRYRTTGSANTSSGCGPAVRPHRDEACVDTDRPSTSDRV